MKRHLGLWFPGFSGDESAMHLEIKDLQEELWGVQGFSWSPAAFHSIHLMWMHLTTNTEPWRSSGEAGVNCLKKKFFFPPQVFKKSVGDSF